MVHLIWSFSSQLTSELGYICKYMPPELITFKVKDWVVFGLTTFLPPYRISDSLINEARIVHVVHGTSKLYAAEEWLTLDSGDTVVMRSDNFVNQWMKNEDGQLNKVIAFQLNAQFLKQLYSGQLPSWFINSNDLTVNAAEKVNPHVLVDGYFNNLQTYLSNSELLSEEVIQVKIRELLSLLIETDQSGKIRAMFGQLFVASDYKLQNVVQKNIFENLGVDELAFLAGLSTSSFKRKFRAMYGTSPNKYITSKRLERAQLLLKTSELSISEIAYDCGYSDVGYFSKVFKNYYNTLPSDLRH